MDQVPSLEATVEGAAVVESAIAGVALGTVALLLLGADGNVVDGADIVDGADEVAAAEVDAWDGPLIVPDCIALDAI